jgi:uncharacterized protein (TIGR02453 family)
MGQFDGFPRELIAFYRGLRENNSKSWFDTHRSDFDNFVMEPARRFVIAMGERLRSISPEIHADPRINKSIFKIHRDVRFSKVKTPFKTHLALWFWEGHRKRMECSGYYFHLEPDRLMLGTGIYQFPPNFLREYRDSVVHPKYGPSLVKVMKEISKRGPYTFGGMHYKRTPRGYDPEHENADLLLHNGLFVGIESAPPREIASSQLVDYCFKRYADMAPLHRWLVAMTERVK